MTTIMIITTTITIIRVDLQKILVAGSTGFIGSALVEFLVRAGHDVWRLRRGATPSQSSKEISLDSQDDLDLFEGFDSVINLSGSSIQRRWTPMTKREIESSRLNTTERLCQILLGLDNPPKAFLCASAIGFYGDRGSSIVDESAKKGGQSFLADLCSNWEKRCFVLENRGIRVVNLRFGIVLSPDGGALQKLLPLFRLGLGGRLGNGKQYMSWVALEDVISSIDHIMRREGIHGAINIVSPHPVTNQEFTRTLAEGLHRPAFLSVPKIILRILKGQMADELLLSSIRVTPAKLLETGYRFHYPTLNSFIHNCL